MERSFLRAWRPGASFIPAAAGAATLMLQIGCPPPADCPDLLLCPAAAAGTGGSGGGAATTGTGGGGGPALDPCAPAEQSNVALDSCGIFVRLEGSDGNPGTPDLPVATLAKAIELAAQKGHVYACQQTFPENLVIATGVKLHGGLDCTMGWSYAGPKANPTIVQPTTGVPLTLASGAADVRLRSFQIVAPAGGAPGGSSIAVIATSAIGVIEDSQLVAGDALSGDDAVDEPQTMDPPAPDGTAGGNACSAAVVSGGVGPANTCGDSLGGNGGDGGPAMGTSGTSGMPAPGGAGGAGDPGMNFTCLAGAGLGHDGLDGANGAAGAAGLSLGKIGEDGYRGADGDSGAPGKPGEGGGGGGGRSGAQCGAGKGGPAGGSGAPGGCGGKGGGGGKSGGASIGIVILTSNITLKNVTITTGNGGRGGKGAEGQPGAYGGNGGPGGSGAPAGCAGGKGGRGGGGGPGGGGRGGHSIGVAHDGSFSAPEGGSITVGSAGPGGPSSSSGNPGAEGAAMEVLKL